jgi:hypothetical protein
MNAATNAVFVCALLALVACEGDGGLGRAIVTAPTPGSPPPDTKCVRERPRCMRPAAVMPQIDGAPVDRDLAPCALSEAAGAVRTGLELSNCELRGAQLDGLAELVNADLQRVRIALGPDQHLTLRESQLTEVAVVPAEESEEVQGELFISHSSMWGSRISSDRVQLLSSNVTSSSIEARQLVSDDVVFQKMDISLQTGTLAAVEMRTSLLHGCHAGVLIAASTLKTTRMRCDGTLQIYASAVDHCSIDGEIEAQNTVFADGVFGLEQPTRITGWTGSLLNMVMCDLTEALHVSAGELTCNDCEGSFRAGEADVCLAKKKPPRLTDNLCDALRRPPPCDGFPEPRRPIDAFSATGI